MRIALAGNPNSGKTTLYNLLTKQNEKVGNWAGVTVSSKESKLKLNVDQDITIVDLPGAYSFSPFTKEEKISKDFITKENLDVIINIVDSTNLDRNLFLTTQLLELNIPVVIALNKTDLRGKKEIEINVEELKKELNVEVVEVSAINKDEKELKVLIEKAIEASKASKNEAERHISDEQRFEEVKSLVSKIEKRSEKSNDLSAQDKIDKVLAHKWLGIPIFAGIMYVIFALSQTYVGPWIAGYLEMFIGVITEFVDGSLPATTSDVLRSLLVDGIIGGVGAVLGFLPLIMVLFFLLALLEDCGYMARVAVVMDRYFKKIGLSGRSIIPIVVGLGCAIPGIMATRTIKSTKQRKTTAMLTPFMPCGAKFPVIALFAGVFFGGESWVSTVSYFAGMLLIVLGAIVIMKITKEEKVKSFFIIELPEYKVPSIKLAFGSMMSRGKAFIVKAGTIILLCNTAIQLMQTFNWQFQVVAEGMENTSILASLANPFALILIPVGFGTWQLAAAAITGFIAKENVVGTLAVVYSITNFIDTDELALIGGETEVAAVMGLSASAALAYLFFNLFTPPCFAAIGAMNSEMEDKKWLAGGILFQLAVGYIVAFIVYQTGTFITLGTFGDGFIYGLLAVAAMVGYIIYLMVKPAKA